MIATMHTASSQAHSYCVESLRVPVQQHTMRLHRPLGDATPPTTLAKRLGRLASSQVFVRKEAGREDLVATRQMVPTLVVKAEHTSRILDKAAILGYLIRAPA
jgi:hypothetical protein